MASYRQQTLMLLAALVMALAGAGFLMASVGQAQTANSYMLDDFSCGGGWNGGSYDKDGNLYVPCSSAQTSTSIDAGNADAGSPSHILVLGPTGVPKDMDTATPAVVDPIRIPENTDNSTTNNIFVFDVAPSPDAKYLYITTGTKLLPEANANGYDYLPETPRRLSRTGDGSYVLDANWNLPKYEMNGRFYTPKGYHIATDGVAGGGSIYLADPRIYASEGTEDNVDTVVKYKDDGTVNADGTDGKFVARFGIGTPQASWNDGAFYHTLTGLAVAPDGKTVYTTENGNNRVQRWSSSDGTSYTYASKFGSNQDNNADRGGYCTTQNAGASVTPSTWNQKLAAPYDVGLDKDGNVYVMNTTCYEVLKFNSTGTLQTGMRVGPNAGDGDNKNGGKPHGFAVAYNGDVYIGESSKKMTLPKTQVVDMELTSITDTPDPVGVNNELTYTIKATNKSSASTARDPWVRLEFPADMTYVSAESSSHTGVTDCINNNDLVGGGNEAMCYVSGSANAQTTVTIKVKPTAPGAKSVKASVSVSGSDTDSIPSNNSKSESTQVSDDTGETCQGKAATKVGTSSGETISGTTGDDVIVGLGGNDTINGLGGNDSICAGDGDDTLIGGGGDDSIDGGDGTDTVSYQDAKAKINVNLTNRDAFDPEDDGKGNAGIGYDSPLDNLENVKGSAYSDYILGDSNKNLLVGGAGADKLYGMAGDDTLNVKDGRRGNDLADGGEGYDTCTGDRRDKRVSCP